MASATVIGSVSISQMVAPATTAASTPTTPARLTLTLRNRLGRDSEADMAVLWGIIPPDS